MKSTLSLILSQKNSGINKVIYPKPSQFLNQYKLFLKSISLAISSSQKFSLTSRLKLEILSIISKKSGLYFKKENLEKLSVKNRPLKYYRWQL
jgi:ribosomal protein S7